jgi:hypothetical protein
MKVQQGDRVMVNVAPFIGSVMRSKESVPCEVLGVDGIHVHVRTDPPYRDVSLWVLSSWIEECGPREALLSSRGTAD